MTKKEKVQIIKKYLDEVYGDAPCTLDYDDPFQLLVATVLAAQCTDARVNLVTPALFKRFPTVQSFAEADTAEVEELIRSTGFFRNKAKNIVACANALLERHDGKVPDTMEELVALPGVGRKIANLLLGDIFGKPAIVADTHMIRICGRFGMYPQKLKDPYKVEMTMSKLVEYSQQSDFCHRIVQFGRDFCSARAPRCSECPVYALCEEGKRRATVKDL